MSTPMSRRAGLPLGALLGPALALALGWAIPADAQSHQLHEFVPPDPSEDVEFAATTIDGNLPAALDTPSGIAQAPDPTRPPDPGKLYAGGTTDDGPGSTYEPDRDTRQPNVEGYEDPFSPTTTPFKRLRAFDAVADDYTLSVADPSLAIVPVGGTVEPGDEPFYADLSVELSPNEPVRLPTVGPGSRVLKVHLSPSPAEQPVLLRDGAENWFIRGTEQKRVRLVMELSISRATFGSRFDPSADWSTLERLVPRASARHPAQAARVLEAVGVSRAQRPDEAVQRLVAYFRDFAASNDPPRVNGDIYLDLALSKKGVCRHRAFAFLVTAINLGIPARMVVNEAHAWVEVNDGSLWHRIDLGGAALDLDQDRDPSRPQHQPPDDPYAWPEGAQDQSGQGLADREQRELGPSSDANGGASGDDTTDPGGSSAPPAPTTSGGVTSPPASSGPPARIEIESIERSVRRGQSLRLRGTVSASGPCRNLRVDVLVTGEARPGGVVIGSLSTDEQGVYDGSVVVPRDLAAGDYEVVVGTSGDARCGAGRSE